MAQDELDTVSVCVCALSLQNRLVFMRVHKLMAQSGNTLSVCDACLTFGDVQHSRLTDRASLTARLLIHRPCVSCKATGN